MMETTPEGPTIEASEAIVNAVCVDVLDLGKVQTPWGTQPQVKIVFESDTKDEFGCQRRLTRTFHKHPHPKSALSTAVKSWCGRDLHAEASAGKLKLDNLKHEQARLKLQPVLTNSGGSFDKIIEILPPGEVNVTPTNYEFEE
jgi:hypothetical protein